MTSTSFLDRIAAILHENKTDSIWNVKVILPNKRAKLFLLEALKKTSTQPQFAPDIISIEDFIQDVSNLRSIDSIELLFEFYEVYLSLTEKKNQQSFEVFANWAPILLQDFNEIDRYLLDPNKILKYLDEIKQIEHWSVDSNQQTDLIKKHLQFWKLLPNYYKTFYNHLLSKNQGYQGILYREAVKNIANYIKIHSENEYIFAGFNALNAAEEYIIQSLLPSKKAMVYWDIDTTFLNDKEHEVGLFARLYKQNWEFYKTNPLSWISNHFSETKNIQIMGTPKSIGQAKIVGTILEERIQQGELLNNTAVILGDENLLLPILYELPAKVDSLNITMGYTTANNPIQILVLRIFKAHLNAKTRNQSTYLFYYKDIVEILNHPLIESYSDSRELVQNIKKSNYTFISHKQLFALQKNPNKLFHSLFDKLDISIENTLETISKLLLTIKSNLDNDNEDDKITKVFVYAVFKVINKLINYTTNYAHIKDLKTLVSFYKQIINLDEVSFEGEPLNGLQIMGVLESRVLDFETVILTSVNEGKFPAGKSQNSFIPYDVKKEYNLPTFREKDAIYAYHFYHLLKRAKNIYLIYNTESEGVDAGEKSRFITQLEIEKQPNHLVSHTIYSPIIPEFASEPLVIPKSESIILRLKEISEKGFSPSALTSYIRNPINFYFQKILHIRETEEVEETVALNTLGTIIHESLKELYLPFLGKYLTEFDLKSCLSKVESEVIKQFKIIYKEGEIKKGKNLLAVEVAKRNIFNFIQLEIANLKKGDTVKIIALEKTFERLLSHPKLPFPVLIRGNVDRIEERNQRIRIIDYKTGKVIKQNVTLKTWEGLTLDSKNDKIIQVLAYAYMYEKEAGEKPIEAGIISFKNLKSGFLPFNFKEDKEAISIIDDQILNNFTAQIVILLQEILNSEIAFEEKV